MKTRSQTLYNTYTPYSVNIDFDEASKSWRENKKYIGNGSYKYICAKIGLKKNQCIYKCLPGEIYCKTHFKMFLEGKLT